MAVVYKVLGQTQGTAGVTTYATLGGAVPTSQSWLISTVSICNQAASAMTYRLAVCSTDTPATSEFIVFGATVPANDTVTLTLGITMQADKRIRVSSSANTCSFAAFGTEIS